MRTVRFAKTAPIGRGQYLHLAFLCLKEGRSAALFLFFLFLRSALGLLGSKKQYTSCKPGAQGSFGKPYADQAGFADWLGCKDLRKTEACKGL